MTTKTIRPARAVAEDEWLAKKLMEAGFGGPDCDFPDCTNARAPRSKGKPGPPPKFCVQHNNDRDRQIAYRARQRLEKERAAAPEPVPVQQAVARGVREEQVLAQLLPRVLTALEAVHAGQEAGADTDAVAAHIVEVQHSADEQVRQAEERRDEAIQAAEEAREQAARSGEVAAEARAEQHAAQLEAATALREAADADQRATESAAARQQLSEEHQRLRGEHAELTGAHGELKNRHQELEHAHTALTGTHGTLLEAHGQLKGEAESLQHRVQELSQHTTTLEEARRRAAADLATAQTENSGLSARLDELTENREELKTANGRLTTQLDEERREHRREMAALRAHLEAARSTAGPSSPAPGDEGEASESTPDQEPEPDAAEDECMPAAIVDLGVHGGSGWSLVRRDADWDTWTVRRDGENTGTVQPERTLLGNSLRGWSAHRSGIPLPPPYQQTHFANREQAAGAVISAALRAAPGPAATAAAGFAALDEPAQAALVAAVIPVVTATPERGGRLARLPQDVRAAALRTALRVPGEQDLALLTGLDPKNLGRSKDARQLTRALESLTGPPGAEDETAPVDLGVVHGRAWRLEPDPDQQGGYRVLADDTEVGTIAPVRRRTGQAPRWAAVHRRRSLGRGPNHGDRDAAARAVIEAERAWVPLPALDDASCQAIPHWLRSNLFGTATRVDPRRGRLAQVQPGAYRRRLQAALGDARRSATGRIRGQHLAVLLDAAREDLGGPGSGAAQRLYDVLQQIREHIVAASLDPTGAGTPES